MMVDYTWVVFISIGSFIVLIGLLFAIGFVIYASIEIRKVAMSLREFLKNTDERMKPLIEETELALRSIRKVSDDVGAVTEGVRGFSSAMNETVQNVRALSGMIGELQEGVSLRVLGLKTGIKTALNVLFKELMRK
ncbi:MAG: DUF948 domain-containing protein [Thermodesulfovibrionales bacterium]|nr:DUF948 domain-containing protein [Thermodesulfovibrionales bacterium]